MTAALVVIDHTDAAPREGVHELLAAARTVAARVHAVWIAADAPAPDVLADLGAHGADHLHHVTTTGADPRLTAVQARGVRVALDASGADLILTSSTFEAKEVAAHLAATTGAGVITDAGAVTREDGRVVADKTVLAGTWTTRCAVRADLAVLTMKAGAARAVVTGAGAPPVHHHQIDADADTRGLRVVERTPAAPSQRPDLASAEVVVAGGRGTEGDFGPIEALADALGAAVGATRVASDQGWVGHDALIGQTGVMVSPRLYIGAGISGAIHHLGGMRAAGAIVAVNNDPEAPIFEVADYGVVGDLFEVLPALVEELRARD